MHIIYYMHVFQKQQQSYVYDELLHGWLDICLLVQKLQRPYVYCELFRVCFVAGFIEYLFVFQKLQWAYVYCELFSTCFVGLLNICLFSRNYSDPMYTVNCSEPVIWVYWILKKQIKKKRRWNGQLSLSLRFVMCVVCISGVQIRVIINLFSCFSALCIRETSKGVHLQTVKTQMKCSRMLHFTRVYSVCKGKTDLQTKEYNLFFFNFNLTPLNVHKFIPVRSHTLVEIDYDINSSVILLPSAESFKKICCQLQGKVCAQYTKYWLTACSSLPRKKCG